MSSLAELKNLGIVLVDYCEGAHSCSAAFDLPDHAAVFRDHFPGRPLLPAIGLLALCDWMMQRWCGPDVRLSGLRKVKFTEPIQPPTRLHIELTRLDRSRVGMVVRSRELEHSTGEWCLGEAAPSEAAAS